MASEPETGRYTPPPGEFVREELKQRGWSQLDLAQILGKPVTHINQIILGNRGVTPDFAVALGLAFDTDPHLWLQRESQYRLFLKSQEAGYSLHTNPENEGIKKRKRLYELAPVKEMQKRGWIAADADSGAIESSVLRFFNIRSLDDEPQIHGGMRKSAANLAATPSQRAWAFRVRQLAIAIPSASVGRFDESKIGECESELRKLAAYSAEIRKVPALLLAHGVRLVIVEGLSGAKMDGFATRLDDDSPVIGLSLRYDRLDSIWFTIGHEWSHIKHRDLSPIDSDIGADREPTLEAKSPMEQRADAESSSLFIPPEELDSFIRRVGPLYSKEKINQFANRIKMHPSIIIGQLKHRREIAPSAYNKSPIPIREAIIKHAITDGWGRSINSGAIT
jgi:HTH-type transcriptional regulator/antitoxin HigA